MKLYCLASGSKANSYILENANGSQLILDCGVKIKDITNSPAFISWRNVQGALITHQHKDHSLGATSLMKIGIPVFAPDNTAENATIQLGEFKVKSFALVHDVACLGYLIQDLVSGKVLVYATDTSALPIIQKADFWLVECNYDQESLDYAIQDNDAIYDYIGRVLNTHLSLEYLLDYFKKPEIQKPKKLIVCHLSHGHANNNKIQEQLKKHNLIGIAEKNKEFDL